MELTAVSRVLILYNQVEEGDDPSTLDILSDVRWVTSGLAELGIPYQVLAIPGWKPWLYVAPDPGTVVFNLFEAPPGVPSAMTSATSGLEAMNLPFTGSSAAALWLTTDKLVTRTLLAAEGLPVAPGGRLDPDHPELLDRVPGPWILKPACEDSSLGLEGDPVCATREAALARARDLQARFPDEPILVERYLPGREFNVSLLAREGGVEILPVAEILFEDYPEGMPRVVSYEAKWLASSFAYAHTRRCFPEDPADGALLARVREISRAAWRICGLRGYARVDLRLDEHGEPYVLEVNANPCLAEDAGFPAAAAKAGLTRGEAMGRIVKDAVRRRPQAVPTVSMTLKSGNGNGLRLRRDLVGSDRTAIAALIQATTFFNPEETGVALELVDDRLAHGEASHYRFLVAEMNGGVAGYACWGPIPGTVGAADLYWIAVHPELQGQGVGAALLRTAEEWMADAGRTRVYIETSTRPQYLPTRSFYAACGYEQIAEMTDFYGPGDGKSVLLKLLSAAAASPPKPVAAPPRILKKRPRRGVVTPSRSRRKPRSTAAT